MAAKKLHRVTRVRLSKGAEGLLIDVPGSSVMSMEFNFRAGYFLSPRGKWEVPHVMEHLSLGANSRYPKARQFEAELTKNGAHNNASTSTYSITYEADCADFEWQRVLDLMLLAISEPLFQEDEFKAEMGNVRDELVSRSNSHMRTMSLEAGSRFGLLSLSDKKRIRQLPSITVGDIRAFYEKTHYMGNLRFVIAGNLRGRRQTIMKMINSAKLRPRGPRIELPLERPKKMANVLHVAKRSVPNVYFDFTTFAPGHFSEQEWDAANLVNNMLTGTLYSKILGTARERGLVYGLGSNFELFRDYVGWSISGQVIPANLLPVIDIAVVEISKVLQGDIAKEDIEAAKQYALGRYQMGAETATGILSGYAGRYFFENTVDDYYAFPERIKEVKKETIVDMMQNIFSKDISGFTTLGSADKALREAAAEKFRSLF